MKNFCLSKSISRGLLTLFFFAAHFLILGQQRIDVVTLSNGDRIECEIIKLEMNRLEIDASYGFRRWEVKWNEVVSIETNHYYNIQIEDGNRFYGRLVTLPSGKVLVKAGDEILAETNLQDIVFLLEYKESFLEKFQGSISLGVNLTKARNFSQLSTNNKFSYKSKNYKLGLTFDALASDQENTESIQRSEGNLSFGLDLPKQYFTYLATSFLSNTEQKINLRWSTQVGAGKLLISDNILDLRIAAGINFNLESFSSSTLDRESIEALLGTKFEVFNYGDLKFYTNVIGYYSITENNRFRSDLKTDLRYNIKYFRKSKLNNKIFIATSFSLNYDNKPANNASQVDYIFTTTLGISWND